MNDMLVLAIELLFALIFVRALVDYAVKRDPLARDVALVFSATATLFFLDLAARSQAGALPPLVKAAAIALLLAQPFLTLRLASHLGLVRGSILVTAFATYVFSTGVFVLLSLNGQKTPLPATLVVVAVFVLTELCAAGFLLSHSRRRTGAARTRLLLAASASIAFAVAILVAGAGAGDPNTAGIGAIISRLLALFAAIGYLLAFFPPAALRRNWQAASAYRFSQDLLSADPLTTVDDLWARFALTSASITGSEGIVVFNSREGEIVEIAKAWLDPESEAIFREASLTRLATAALGNEAVAGTQERKSERLLTRLGRHFATVVSINTDKGPIAIVYLSRYQSLFAGDDRDILVSLARGTIMLAERRAILSEQERLTAELAASVVAAHEASQAKSDFLSSMSHELRTPLTAIIGFSDLMRDEPTTNRRTSVPDEWIEHIHQSGGHLLALVNDVLDLAKVEAGRLELDRRSFDLGSAINESIAGLSPLSEKKGLRLRSEVAAGTLTADRGRFRQILYNLLSNAIKYTSSGGEICVTATIENGWVSIAVSDTGVGISAEDMLHLFEEFRQLGDPDEHEPGTGLGLALTRRLVEAHGGRLEATSVLHEGSTFTVWLPQGDVSPAAVSRPASEPVIIMGGRGRDVLIIEDELAAAELLRTYLEVEGYTVRTASDGEAGLAEVARRLPAAIILDVMLPGIDGWEVLRRLKADPHTHEVPVIIATVIENLEMGLALGAVDYLVKPPARTTLLEILARYAPVARAGGGPTRILAVDDDPAVLTMIRATLEPEGFEVLTASGGAAGLVLAHQRRPDLIICDLLMPDLDGFAVVAALKSDRRVRDIPILILTMHDLSAADKERLEGHILGVISKGDNDMLGLKEWLDRVAPRPGRKTA